MAASTTSWLITRRGLTDDSDRMANRRSAVIEITPEVLLKAYACGIFPMAERRGWRSIGSSELRGIIRSSASTCRRDSPARYKPTTSPSPSTATSTAPGCAEPRHTCAHLDQAHPPALSQNERRHCLASRCMTGRIWSAVSTGSRSAAPSSASMFHRARPQDRAGASVSAAQVGGFKLLDTVRDRSPEDFRRRRGAAAAYRLLEAASPAKATSAHSANVR